MLPALFLRTFTCASYIQIKVRHLFTNTTWSLSQEMRKTATLRTLPWEGRSSHSVPARAYALCRHCSTLYTCHESDEGWTMPLRLLKACMSWHLSEVSWQVFEPLPKLGHFRRQQASDKNPDYFCSSEVAFHSCSLVTNIPAGCSYNQALGTHQVQLITAS